MSKKAIKKPRGKARGGEQASPSKVRSPKPRGKARGGEQASPSKVGKKVSVPTTKNKAVKKTAKKAASKKPVKKTAPKKTVKKAAPKKAAKQVKKTVKPLAKATAKISRPHPPLLKAIINGLEEKKAKNITVLDLTQIGGRAFDYFVIADADSGTHVESIAASAEEMAKKELNERPYHTEGWQNAEWILLDYINIVVHVFQRSVREFYNLEGLWADAEIQKIN